MTKRLPFVPIVALGVAALIIGALVFGRNDGAPSILLENAAATVVTTHGTPTIAITAAIRNSGGPDRLTGVEAKDVKLAMLAGEEDLSGLAIPAGGGASLAMDGAHAMLMGLAEPPEEGRLIPFTLTFEKAGRVAAKARVAAHSGMAGMDHGAALDMAAAEAPAIAVSAERTEGGWRVEAAVERFRFAPEAMDGPHVAGEGHAHLYIGGLKIMRMTTPEVEIGALPPGAHRIRVSLNTNDHRPYHADGAPVAVTVEVTSP